jgi:hypothetical protein
MENNAPEPKDATMLHKWEIINHAGPKMIKKITLSKIIRKYKKIQEPWKPYLPWTSSPPLILLITQDMPALVPVMTAKFLACTKGPPAKAYNSN